MLVLAMAQAKNTPTKQAQNITGIANEIEFKVAD
jgi:hypothetical protein